MLIEHGDTVAVFEGYAAGRLLPALLPLLDGTRTVDEIHQSLGRPVVPAVVAALSLLARNNLLLDGPSSGLDVDDLGRSASFASQIGRTTIADAAKALETATVDVLGSSTVAAEAVRQLRESGIGRIRCGALDSPPGGSSFVVAAPSGAEATALDALNTHQLERGIAWLPILPYDGRRLVVGPLVLPGQSACGRCYAIRRAAASGYEADFESINRLPVGASSPAPIAALAAGLATVLVLRWLASSDPRVPGWLSTLALSPALRLDHHRVLRVPRCPACRPYDRALPTLWFDDEG